MSWATVLGPTYSSASGSLLEKLVGLAYPLGDVIMGSIVLFILPRTDRGSRLPLLLVGGGILANTLADSGFTYLQLNNLYGTVNPIDAGWVLGYLLIGLGALRDASHETPPTREDSRISQFSALLPYPLVGVAAIVATVQELRGGSFEALFWVGLIVLLMVVGRQLVTLVENLSLTRTLEAKVRARTAELRDDRRAISEERSHHITTGLNYLPAIARRLYHSRDLGEPFDFLTWFDYAPASSELFEELVGKLRETEEWAYVERDIDIRLRLQE